jgi:hypothetical protein
MNNIEELLVSYNSAKTEYKNKLSEIFEMLDFERIEEDLDVYLEDEVSDDIKYNPELKKISFTNIHPEFSNYVTYKLEDLPLKGK